MVLHLGVGHGRPWFAAGECLSRRSFVSIRPDGTCPCRQSYMEAIHSQSGPWPGLVLVRSIVARARQQQNAGGPTKNSQRQSSPLKPISKATSSMCSLVGVATMGPSTLSVLGELCERGGSTRHCCSLWMQLCTDDRLAVLVVLDELPAQLPEGETEPP
jgi:hypothetical protein